MSVCVMPAATSSLSRSLNGRQLLPAASHALGLKTCRFYKGKYDFVMHFQKLIIIFLFRISLFHSILQREQNDMKTNAQVRKSLFWKFLNTGFVQIPRKEIP